MRPPAVDAARALVAEKYPDAIQAWLAGSTTTGRATATSDLDITVLLAEVDVHRESLEYAGWPVEVFVHTAASIGFFVAKDLERRHPTMARLVASGVPLLGDGGADVRWHCEEVLERGPGPVAAEDLELIRLVRAAVSIPVIASGGAGTPADFPPAVDAGADAVLAATVFHFGTVSIAEVKTALSDAGHAVR